MLMDETVWDSSIIYPPDNQRRQALYKHGEFEILFNKLTEHVITEFSFTGSRMICSPPPTDTDRDIILLYNTQTKQTLYEILCELGWVSCIKEFKNKSNYSALSNWQAFRKGEDNVIITQDKEHFDLFLYATKISTVLNLTNKQDRIRLFNFILKFDKTLQE